MLNKFLNHYFKMTMSKLLFSSLIISILMLSCSRDKIKQADNNKNKEEQLSDKGSLFINVEINNDSSSTEIIEGNITYYFQVNDSLLISNKDRRNVFLAVGIKPVNNLAFKKNEKDLFQNNLEFQLKKSNDTLIIPFNLTKQFKGEAIIYGGIQDSFVLNRYTDDSEKVRMLIFDNQFEANTYVK